MQETSVGSNPGVSEIERFSDPGVRMFPHACLTHKGSANMVANFPAAALEDLSGLKHLQSWLSRLKVGRRLPVGGARGDLSPDPGPAHSVPTGLFGPQGSADQKGWKITHVS